MLTTLLQRTRAACLTTVVLALAACAPSMRSEAVPGSFAWFDLVTDQPEAARSFYSGLFGWRFADGPADNLQIISNRGELIGGLVQGDDQDTARPESQWKPVLSVSDTSVARARAVSSGANPLGEVVQTRSGQLAALRDPTGAVLTIYDGVEGVPLGTPPRVGSWVWVDLLTGNPSRARRFYRDVAGFETRKENRDGTTSFEVFSSNGKDRGGMIPISRSAASPGWIAYVGVDNIDETLARAQALGATVPARAGDVAIVIDPTGAVFGVAQRPAN
ncbi:VOC family protein [Primorskyibacter sp. S87]|uniref:VOC family protein n=1 Tax=Primorskyibacter sp. S87 TaxID=3415126 RepID=UPI003C7C7152